MSDVEVAGYAVMDTDTGNQIGWFESKSEALECAAGDSSLIVIGYDRDGFPVSEDSA